MNIQTQKTMSNSSHYNGKLKQFIDLFDELIPYSNLDFIEYGSEEFAVRIGTKSNNIILEIRELPAESVEIEPELFLSENINPPIVLAKSYPSNPDEKIIKFQIELNLDTLQLVKEIYYKITNANKSKINSKYIGIDTICSSLGKDPKIIGTPPNPKECKNPWIYT